MPIKKLSYKLLAASWVLCLGFSFAMFVSPSKFMAIILGMALGMMWTSYVIWAFGKDGEEGEGK